MVAFLCLFFPPVIAVALTTKIRKENVSYSQYIVYYGMFTVIINGIMFWILSFMFGDGHSISSPDVFTTNFSAKYVLLSSILAVISAYIMEGIRKFKPVETDMSEDEETKEETD